MPADLDSVDPSEAGGTPLAEVTVSEFGRMTVTATVLLVVGVLFIMMMRPVFLSAVLGVVVAVYLHPLHRWLDNQLGAAAAGIASLTLLLVPLLAAAVYGYMELQRAVSYLQENTGQVASEIAASLQALPLVNSDPHEAVARAVDGASGWAAALPDAVQSAAGHTAVALSVFLFTAFYVLTRAEEIIAWIRRRVAKRYVPLLQSIERNASGALYGAVYATLLSQGLKAGVILVLNLVLGVPLPLTLALLVFVIGFFPVVGAWTVYLPIGVYLLVFQNAPMKAMTMVVLSGVLCTGLISMVLRPKIAAGHSQVLDFYWMFLGLIAGVFVFGLPGIVAGPLVVALLKAMLDTIVGPVDEDPAGRPEAIEDKNGREAKIMDAQEM